ncbi:MAG: aminotransferase class I/II-fold pyridoxal phosphate-dependent enzyme, partial [Desulfobacterales bacterium]
QRAAEAVYSPEGKQQVREIIDFYMNNAAHIREEIDALGYDYVGGTHSPYIWINTRADSWDFFDMLLNKAGVVCTPGLGFGTCGEKFIRLSAFNSYENIEAAMNRIREAVRS